jgi:hypothetical protein
MSIRVSTILVGRNEKAVRIACQILECLGKFSIVDLGIKAADHRSHLGVKSEICQVEGI